jgi:hypothetical protein
MRKLLLLTLAFVSANYYAQKETNVSSTIEKVTVFFQGAQLEHSASTKLEPGKQSIVLNKLTDFIDPNSVQVKAQGDLTILSVTTRKNYEDVTLTDEQIKLLNEKKKKLEVEDQKLRDEFNVLSYDKDLILRNRDLTSSQTGLKITELKEAYLFMHEKLTDIGTRQTAIYEELEKLAVEMNQIEQEIISQRSKPVINYSEIVVELDVAKTTTASFSFSYISPNASWQPYYDMRSDGIGKPVKLEAKGLISQTTGIEWKDVDLVLSTNDPYENTTEPDLQPWYLYYYNYPQQQYVQQRTVPQFNYGGQKLRGEVIDAVSGEPMPFAKVSFPSNPSIGVVTDFDGKFEVIVPQNESYVTVSYIGYESVQLPINSPYLKFFLQPQEIELEEIQVMSYNSVNTEVMESLSFGYGDGIYQYSSAPNVAGVISSGENMELFGRKKNKVYKDEEDGKYNSYAYDWSPTVATTVTQKDLRVEYAIQSKFSIPSDGTEQRVNISNYDLAASYEYHTAPKIDPSVYLSAQVSGWESLNLLNGDANMYFDGTYIGKTYIDVNSTKDTLSFSLGKDNKIQIERTKIKEKCTNKTIGSRQKFEVSWEIKIKNNGGAAIPIFIKDQFPISNDNDIKVKNGEYGDGILNEQNGIITWKSKLNSGENKTIQFNYSVDYQNGAILYLE